MVNELKLSEMLGFAAKWYSEGRARFIAPVFPTTEQGEPSEPTKSPVFYNPFSKLSRDLTVLVVKTFDRKVVVAEPLAGSGVRSIRLLLETVNVSKALLNDINPNAVKVIRLNSSYNNVSDLVEVYEGDAAVFLTAHSDVGKRCYYVDVDPVGSPAKFVENSLRACETGGYIGVSATDLASLVGNYPATCYRRYGIVSGRTFFGKEVALRVLASHVISRGASINVAAYPVLSVYHRHFVRVFFRVWRGRSKCIQLLKRLGWIQSCSRLHYSLHPLTYPPQPVCKVCGCRANVIGPIWLGQLHEPELVEKLIKNAEGYDDALKVLNKIAQEVEVVGFYPVDQLARMAHTKPISPSKLVERLREMGYRASFTHVDPTGVKTDAQLDEILPLFS